MPKVNDTEIFPFESPININDYVFGTRDSDKKNRNFLVSDLLALVVAMLNLDVLTLVITASSDEIQSDSLIGATQIISITGENQVYTDFSAFTEFELNSETGTVTGFPFTTGAKYIIAYTTQEED